MLGGNPMDFLRIFRNRENVYFDTALQSQSMISEFVKQVGAERVLFGSDIPFGSMKSELNRVLSLRIGDDDKALILSGNLKRLTGLV